VFLANIVREIVILFAVVKLSESENSDTGEGFDTIGSKEDMEL